MDNNSYIIIQYHLFQSCRVLVMVGDLGDLPPRVLQRHELSSPFAAAQRGELPGETRTVRPVLEKYIFTVLYTYLHVYIYIYIYM